MSHKLRLGAIIIIIIIIIIMSHKLRLGAIKQSKNNMSHKLRLGAIIIGNGANTICLPNYVSEKP